MHCSRRPIGLTSFDRLGGAQTRTFLMGSYLPSFQISAASFQSFTQDPTDPTHWSINSSDGLTQDILTLANGAAAEAGQDIRSADTDEKVVAAPFVVLVGNFLLTWAVLDHLLNLLLHRIKVEGSRVLHRRIVDRRQR